MGEPGEERRPNVDIKVIKLTSKGNIGSVAVKRTRDNRDGVSKIKKKKTQKSGNLGVEGFRHPRKEVYSWGRSQLKKGVHDKESSQN